MNTRFDLPQPGDVVRVGCGTTPWCVESVSHSTHGAPYAEPERTVVFLRSQHSGRSRTEILTSLSWPGGAAIVPLVQWTKAPQQAGQPAPAIAPDGPDLTAELRVLDSLDLRIRYVADLTTPAVWVPEIGVLLLDVSVNDAERAEWVAWALGEGVDA